MAVGGVMVPDSIRIERMTAEDASAYAADLEEFDDAAWVFELYEDFINDPYGYFFKAYMGTASAGFCSAYHNTMNPIHFCKIMDLRVKPAFRRRGIAKALMLEVLALAENLGLDRSKLEVDTKSEAVRLYESLGFKIEETEEAFYDNGSDAYIMWRYE